MPDDRVHDVSAMTNSELERARRHLVVSLSLAFPGSPVRGPILAHNRGGGDDGRCHLRGWLG
jgi:hypothetical protein